MTDKVKLILPSEKSNPVKIWARQKFLTLGPGGIGKSDLWSRGKTLFIATEKAHDHLNAMTVDVDTWDDFLEVGAELIKRKTAGDFPWDCICIDTVDRWVNMGNDYVINHAREKFKNIDIVSIGDIPNGQGWYMATNLIGMYLRKLESLGVCISLIGHHNTKRIKEGVREYDKSTISIGGQMGIQIVHWADHILYIDGKMVGESVQRTVYVQPSQIREAKSRGCVVPNGWKWSDNMQENWDFLRGLFT